MRHRCWVFGQFIAAGVNRGCVTRQDQWAYRIPFAIQWMWPIPIAIGVMLAPESPWWYVNACHEVDVSLSLLSKPCYEIQENTTLSILQT